MCLENIPHGEFPHLHLRVFRTKGKGVGILVGLHKVECRLVAHLQFQFVRNGLAQSHFALRPFFLLSFLSGLPPKQGDRGGPFLHSFHHHAQEVVVGLDHRRLGHKALHTFHLCHALHKAEHRVAYAHGRQFVGAVRNKRLHLQVSAEVDHFLAHLLLEAHDDSHRNKHHRHTNGNAADGDANGRR